MRKKIAIVLLSIMTACAVMMGCEEVLSKEQAFDELDGFSAAKTATVEMGSNYTVLPVVAFGADGKEYTAAVTVTVGGQSVEVKDGTFAGTKPDDYTVTYTIEYKGYTFTQTTLVKPADTAAPRVKIENDWKKNAVGAEMTLPTFTVTDAGGIKSTEVKIIDPSNSETIVETAGGGDVYTPQKAGRYTFSVTATDWFDHSSTEQTYFFASGARAEFDVFEDFEGGVDDTFVTDNAQATGNALVFTVDGAADNTFLTADVRTAFPEIHVGGSKLADYMAKGYDIFSFEIWGDNAEPATWYIQTASKDKGDAENAYKYLTMQPNRTNTFTLTKDEVTKILSIADNTLRFVCNNDGVTHQDYTVNIDNFGGMFAGPTFLTTSGAGTAESYLPDVLSSEKVSGYKLVRTADGNTVSGDADDTLTFTERGDYTLELILSSGITANVSMKVGFEIQPVPGTEFGNDFAVNPSLLDEYFSNENIERVVIKLKGTNANAHDCYAYNKADVKAWEGFVLQPQIGGQFVLLRDAYTAKKNAGVTINFGVKNNVSSEPFSVWVEGVELYAGGVTLLLPGDNVALEKCLPGTIAKADVKSFKLYDSENTVVDTGAATDTLEFANRGEYNLALALTNDSTVNVSVTVGLEGKPTSGAEWGNDMSIAPSLFDEYFSDAKVGAVIITLKGTNANAHDGYAYNKADASGWTGFVLQPQVGGQFVLQRDAYTAKKNAGRTIDFGIKNNVNPEEFTVWVESVETKAGAVAVITDWYPSMQIPKSHLTRILSTGATAVQVTMHGTTTADVDCYITTKNSGYDAYIRATLSKNGGDVTFLLSKEAVNSIAGDYFSINFNNTDGANTLAAFTAYVNENDFAAYAGGCVTANTNTGWAKIEVPLSYFDALFTDTANVAVEFAIESTCGKWHDFYIENTDGSGRFGTYRLPANGTGHAVLKKESYTALKNANKNLAVQILSGNGSSEGMEDFSAWIEASSLRGVTGACFEEGSNTVTWPAFAIPDSMFDFTNGSVTITIRHNYMGAIDFYTRWTASAIKSTYAQYEVQLTITREQYEACCAVEGNKGVFWVTCNNTADSYVTAWVVSVEPTAA